MDGSEGGASPQPSWRDRLKIHPAANLCPPMSRDELLALGEDIKANGSEPTIPIVLLQPKKGPPLLLDGRNRLDAMEMVGLPTLTPDGKPVNSKTFEEHDGVDPYAYVLTANLHRRHLTGDQRGDLIRKIKVERPDLSTRAVADIVGTSKDITYPTGSTRPASRPAARQGQGRQVVSRQKRAEAQAESAKGAEARARQFRTNAVNSYHRVQQGAALRTSADPRRYREAVAKRNQTYCQLTEGKKDHNCSRIPKRPGSYSR